MPRESITLYFREGSSDKAYRASIDEKDSGYVVNFAYGRRGSTMQTGSKTPRPVDFVAAKRIYDKLVHEKTAKGYTPGADGTPYSSSENEQRDSGIRPQLLNPVDESELEALVADDGYWLQEKKDGQRVLLMKSGETITGINRKGLTIALPESIVSSAHEIGEASFILDGEAIGDHYYAFDVLKVEEADFRPRPYCDRYAALAFMLDTGVGTIELLQVFTTARTKRDELQRLRRVKAEGVVFKRRDASYTPGRPASGGPQLKHKFYATCSAIVSEGRPGKRSVGLELLHDGRTVGVGNVMIPPKVRVPAFGQIVEVRYLYAYPGGSLYQPTFIGVRDDIPLGDCTLAQLKFKQTDDEDA